MGISIYVIVYNVYKYNNGVSIKYMTHIHDPYTRKRFFTITERIDLNIRKIKTPRQIDGSYVSPLGFREKYVCKRIRKLHVSVFMYMCVHV